MRAAFAARRHCRKGKNAGHQLIAGVAPSAPPRISEPLWTGSQQSASTLAHCLVRCDRRHCYQTLTTPLRLLDKRGLMLAEEFKTLDVMLKRLSTQRANRFQERSSVGPQTAAVIVVVANDHPEGLTCEAVLAASCVTSPLQASSGKTIRHRRIGAKTDPRTTLCGPSRRTDA
jgi:hypothetical protein